MAVPVLMPALSPTMTEGNLAKWVKKEGEKVAPGHIIAEIETDKAIMEMEVVDNGVLSKILVAEGSSGVKINTLIAVLLEDGDDESAVQAIIDQYGTTPKSAEHQAQHQNTAHADITRHVAEKEVGKPTSVQGNHDNAQSRIFASPLAKRIAAQMGVSLENIKGGGPNGRIIKADVLNASNNTMGSTIETSQNNCNLYGRHPQEFEKLPVSGIRKVIAKRLMDSKQTIPHFYVTFSCAIDNLLDIRKQINASAAEKDGKLSYKISVNDLIIKATAKAMHEMPVVNSSWNEDYILQYNNIDISVAVSTDGGLITPIVRNADQKSIIAISEEMKSLASKARANKLRPEEFQGGGLSISNLGMYGIDKFDAIINPPQSCIVAVGAGIERPVVKDGKIEIATVIEVTLSCDHRIVDGAVAAQFANTLKKFIENPILMLL